LKERLLNGQPVGNKALNKYSNPRFFKNKAAEKEKF